MDGPIAAYVAVRGTAFPLVSAVPAAAWILLGVQGAKNITEDGVHIIMEDTKEIWRGLGSTAPQKAFRTMEDGRVEFELADVTIEALSHAFGGAPTATPAGITTVAAAAGIPGTKAINILRGFPIQEVALLLRKEDSPYNAAFNMQWEIPRAVINSNTDLTFVKGQPGLVQFSFQLLEDPTLGMGKIVAQTAAPI